MEFTVIKPCHIDGKAFERGDVVKVAEPLASRLVAAGYVKAGAPEPEAAVAAPAPERAVKPKPRRTRRRG